MSTGTSELASPATSPLGDPGAHRPAPVWKQRGTRKPLVIWDRVKFLLLIGLLFGLLVWNEYLRYAPLATVGQAAQQVAVAQRWVLVLACLEFARQLHFVVCERSARYNRFWTERVFGRVGRYTERRFTAWTRFRLKRVVLVVFWLVVIAVALGRALGTTPVSAMFQTPVLLVKALPLLLQVLLLMVITIGQFALLFWYMSRGGIETIYPDDVETRFSDVWGQDHVLARVSENMMLLERPEAIEDRGGHVPTGILLWGPPGTGKTLMAEAVAGETGKPYVFVDPGAFTNMFMGVGILKVKGLFRRLRKLALRYGGVIVFFDEADSLGSRGGAVAGAVAGDASRPGQLPGHGPHAQPSAAWDSAGCHGFSHLSGPSQEVLARAGMTGGSAGFIPGFNGGANGGGNSGGMGTLQALLTELSGLKKPRGFFNRVVRRALGMRPKPPPRYRILVMMATNQPDSLDPALLRPGRIDRVYRVGYPSKAGRIRTYQGYLDKTSHELTAEQVEKLAVITPYATGATIKDLVNEALISAIRDGRETITWKDVIRAKHLNDLGPGEDVEYIERERHAVAVHEACHAVLAWATRRHLDIDIATIEKGSGYLGMVKSIPPEEQFTRWRSEYESDILVALASLAGERMFYDGDNSSGVSGDLNSATVLTALMESHWGMGKGVTSLPALQQLGIGGGGPQPQRPGQQQRHDDGSGHDLGQRIDDGPGPNLGARIEQNLTEMLAKAEASLIEHRPKVLALAHALEEHKTLTGEDVIAVLEGRPGPLVDGTPYTEPDLVSELERYHEVAVEAHRRHAAMGAPLPVLRLAPPVAAAAEPMPESDAAWKLDLDQPPS